MSTEILFYDASIQSSARSNKGYSPNTLYENLLSEQRSQLTQRSDTQPSSLRTQLQKVVLQDRVGRIP